MKTKGPFVKVVSLNGAIKYHLFQPNLDIGSFLTHFTFPHIHINE
jgi:hypothetical protein